MTTRLTAAEKKANRAYAMDALRRHYDLKPGMRIYASVASVSASALSRSICFYIVDPHLPGRARRAPHQGNHLPDGSGPGPASSQAGHVLTIKGCGQDMAFDCIYRLGRAMFPEGFKMAKHQHGRNGDTSRFEKDGGYAFRNEYL